MFIAHLLEFGDRRAEVPTIVLMHSLEVARLPARHHTAVATGWPEPAENACHQDPELSIFWCSLADPSRP
jgi:hypothetical protein